MPPRGADHRGHCAASMRGGMRMPPNCHDGTPPSRHRARFNEGRHAHAAECAGRARMSTPPSRASMRGGMRMPPNHPVLRLIDSGVDASMRGGMRMPPNSAGVSPAGRRAGASMRGGMRMPPNWQNGGDRTSPPCRFNEGRHAHAAEWSTGSRAGAKVASFNEGRHAHAAEYRRAGPRRERRAAASMRGGMRMPPNRSLRKGGLTWGYSR